MSGWNPNSPSNLYLMRNDAEGAWKVGISVNVKRRTYFLPGFTVVAVWPFPNGRLARVVEQAIHRDWRASGFPYALEPTVIGYTETVSMELVTEDEICAAIASVMEVVDVT